MRKLNTSQDKVVRYLKGSLIFPKSREKIAAKTGLTQIQANRAINALERRGVVFYVEPTLWTSGYYVTAESLELLSVEEPEEELEILTEEKE